MRNGEFSISVRRVKRFSSAGSGFFIGVSLIRRTRSGGAWRFDPLKNAGKLAYGLLIVQGVFLVLLHRFPGEPNLFRGRAYAVVFRAVKETVNFCQCLLVVQTFRLRLAFQDG
jgi:hypothetical protein